MRVIVLGAGASYGASNWNVVRPPLVDRFFSAAAAHGLLQSAFGRDQMENLKRTVHETGGDWSNVEKSVGGTFQGHLATLKALVQEQLGVTPDELDTKPVNIERLFGLIEAELLGRVGFQRYRGAPSEKSFADALEQQLYLVICGTLIASTSGIDCEHHRKLAEWLEPGDVVLSFNYDLLADRALKARGGWSIDNGYGLKFHRVGHWASDGGKWRTPGRKTSEIRLLKPHGSLNWLYCRDPWESNVNVSLRGITPKSAPEDLYCLEDMHSDLAEDFPLFEWWARYEHEDKNGYAFDLHSLIVPPAITKHYRSFEPFIGGVWAQAVESLLVRATELYFIGYSLRAEDLRSWWLFRKAAVEAAKLRKVWVVDPSDDVLQRIRTVFAGRETDRRASTLGEFVGTL